MQEMTGGICNQASVNDSKQLIDSRDGKIYWVTKLKDNNCWMTQNLDLDLSMYNTLTPEDTDLIINWTPTASTQITASPSGFSGNNVVASWDPAKGGAATYCNNGGVAGKCKTSGNSTTSINGGHDAQGNYYTWAAATAGQAATLTSSERGEQATQSICPKGWRLPLSGVNGSNNTVSRSFYYLLNQYGLTSKTPGTEINGITYSIDLSPLYFVYGGYVGSSSLNNAGSYGYYWSSTAFNSSSAYFLSFTTSVLPSNSNLRYFGFSVRCVAR